MVKIYGNKLNPLVRACHAFLKLNNIEFEQVEVSLNDIMEESRWS